MKIRKTFIGVLILVLSFFINFAYVNASDCISISAPPVEYRNSGGGSGGSGGGGSGGGGSLAAFPHATESTPAYCGEQQDAPICGATVARIAQPIKHPNPQAI